MQLCNNQEPGIRQQRLGKYELHLPATTGVHPGSLQDYRGLDFRSPDICRSILKCPVQSLRREEAEREGMLRSPLGSQP